MTFEEPEEEAAEDLIPEFTSGSHSNIGTIGVALGFTLMMVLDIALG